MQNLPVQQISGVWMYDVKPYVTGKVIGRAISRSDSQPEGPTIMATLPLLMFVSLTSAYSHIAQVLGVFNGISQRTVVVASENISMLAYH